MSLNSTKDNYNFVDYRLAITQCQTISGHLLICLFSKPKLRINLSCFFPSLTLILGTESCKDGLDSQEILITKPMLITA